MGVTFARNVLEHDPGRRRVLLEIAARSLAAVDPMVAVPRRFKREGSHLVAGDRSLDLAGCRRAVVLGMGKAAVGMGRAVLPALRGLEPTGVLATDRAEPVPPLEVVEGSHPVPDARSVAAGERLLSRARELRPEEFLVVLISGGGSALVEVPASGLDLAVIERVNALLLHSGADITDVNAVRKHLSAIKGGRLAEAAAGAGAVVSLVLSDVVGNPLDVIASGPTVRDPTTFADALAVLDRRGLRDRVPVAAVEHLKAGARGERPETPSGGDVFARQHIVLVADAGRAAAVAAQEARERGCAARVVTARMTGEARRVARGIVAEAKGAALDELLVYAGESTVTVRGRGSGGRNQELALAAAVALEGDDEVVVLALGTDGIDGETNAAGAFADGATVARGRRAGLDAADHLARNDSHSFLATTGDVVVSGRTGTNVGDLILAWRHRPS